MNIIISIFIWLAVVNISLFLLIALWLTGRFLIKFNEAINKYLKA